MKKKRRIVILIVVGVCMAGLFVFCGSRQTIKKETIHEDKARFVVGVNENMPQYCIVDNGMLYGENHNIHYYDLSSEEDYILCDEINCTHLSERCSSYYEDSVHMNGLALYKGYVYFFDKNSESNSFDFFRMDTSGNNKKKITSIAIGDYQNNAWFLESISEIYYCGNQVWLNLSYKYIEENGSSVSSVQLVGVGLDSGEIVEVNEKNFDQEVYRIEACSKDTLLLSKRWIGISEEQKNPVMMESYYGYCIATNELTLLEEAPLQINDNIDGQIVGFYPKYIGLGVYGEDFLLEEPDWDMSEEDKTRANTRLFLWNVNDNTQEEMCVIENGSVVAIGEGQIGNAVYEDGKILFLQYKNQDKSVVCEMNLDTGESKTLFEDDANMSFRIMGVTNNSFIGAIYMEGKKSMTKEVYQISKKEYYSGNFEQMVLLNKTKL